MGNPLQLRLQSHSPLLGTFVTVASGELTEALSLSGLHCLVFDWEHAPLSIADLQHLVRAVHPPCLSFIRIPEPEPVYVKKALDTGCDGIIVPQVNSAEIAKQVIDAGKYSPLGNRGIGLSRSTTYGATLGQAIRSHNQQKSILVQIEHIDAVQNLEAILAVPGLDGIFVGPNDLASSMGHVGDVPHPQVQAAIKNVAAIARKTAIPMAIFAATDDAIPTEGARGFQIIVVGSDIMRLTASARATVAR